MRIAFYHLVIKPIRKYRCCNMSSVSGVQKWEFEYLLHGFDRSEGNNEKYSMVILNAPIRNPQDIIPLWKRAHLRIVVDGGANQLYDLLQTSQIEESTDLLPDLLCGDFDSIRANVRKFYEQRRVKIIPTPNQNKTDFFKALEIVSEKSKNSTVIVCCDNVGRLDHIMGNINVLHLAAHLPNLKDLKIYLSGHNNLTWLLKPGRHVIRIPPSLWSEKSHCALLPIGQPCYHVTTTGLKWNLDDDVLQFGGMVSSSNTYDTRSNELEVQVNTDGTLIWSMGTEIDE